MDELPLSKTIKDISLAEECLANQEKEVEELINDYKINAMKNFVPYENGNDELKKWVNGLDGFNSEIDIPNIKTIRAIKDARAKKNLMKVEDISFIENFSKQEIELDLLVEDKYKKE